MVCDRVHNSGRLSGFPNLEISSLIWGRSSLLLSVGNRTQWGRGGNVKEGLKLTLMSSFDIEQGGINSRPGSCGVPEWVQTDGPGFSLCAAPLELSGPGFCGVGQRLGK